ncbi:MAG: flagellar protein FlaG [Shewanella sp.]|uniref:flagellar protein FlaG n=1 Tax=Shewanella sp. TaxID=50422 RepID=UPI0026488060|nr:flagellar protein FlaG [Shewanella sp.]MDN5498452.1 flagellar protein FlaG [Shewanella sp.]MDN5526489.1 flagellar protein FlaG [Shewanella sp.]
MDVNVSNTSISSARKDHMAALADNKTNAAEQPKKGVPATDDSVRSVEQVNQTAQVDAEELQQAVKEIAASMNLMQKGLAFNIDEDSGKQVVKVIDEQTGDLIRQIPNEEALEIAKKLSEVAGLLMKTEV